MIVGSIRNTDATDTGTWNGSNVPGATYTSYYVPPDPPRPRPICPAFWRALFPIPLEAKKACPGFPDQIKYDRQKRDVRFERFKGLNLQWD